LCENLKFEVYNELVKEVYNLMTYVVLMENDQTILLNATEALNNLFQRNKLHFDVLRKWTLDSGCLAKLITLLKFIFLLKINIYNGLDQNLKMRTY